MPHYGNIWIPLSTQQRLLGDLQSYNKAKKTWKRPWRDGPVRLPGSALVVTNQPFTTEKGERKHLNPIQAACLALKEEMIRKGNWRDVIRVITPGAEGKFEGEIDFSVRELMKMHLDDPVFFPQVERGEITLEDEARNLMPYRWGLSESGVFAPS